MEGKEKKQRRLFLIYTLILLGFFILNTRVLYLAIIPSESMEPTIKVGNLVVGTRGDNKSIERYDIAIFKSPDDESRTLIKRVIGLPGETIEIKNGHVYADGVKLKESFVNELSSDDGIYKVPKDCYFMMGETGIIQKTVAFGKINMLKRKKSLPGQNISFIRGLTKSLKNFNLYPLSYLKQNLI